MASDLKDLTAAKNTLVAEAETASAAVRALYEYCKAVNPKMSLAYLCTRAGMKSKGYLSDVVRGRRTLNAKFAAPLASAFGLKGHAARTFKLLADLETGRLGPAEREKAAARLAVLRRSLTVTREPLPSEMARMAMAFEVYCAFGLYGNAPTKADLLRYFGERHLEQLEAAITMLKRHGLVEEGGGKLRATKVSVVFGVGTGLGHLDFLRSSLRDAERHLKQWFPRKDEAYIESVILSVRKKDYLDILPLLRERVLETRAQLDTEEADMLVRFNVQIYPVRDPGERHDNSAAAPVPD